VIIIKPKTEFVVTVEAELTPELAEKDLEEIKKFKVYYGKDVVELGELFEITKEGDDRKLVLEGDFSRVKWIGCRMTWGRDNSQGQCRSELRCIHGWWQNYHRR